MTVSRCSSLNGKMVSMSWMVVMPECRHSAAPKRVRARTSSALRLGYDGGRALRTQVSSGMVSKQPFKSTSWEW